MVGRRVRPLVALMTALAATAALAGAQAFAGGAGPAAAADDDGTSTGPTIISRTFEDGDLSGVGGLGVRLSVVDDDTKVLRADDLHAYGGDVNISIWDEELGGPSWFSGSVRMKLPAGSPTTYFQVFANDIPAGPATAITDQTWTYLGFGTPYNGSTTAGLPGTSSERVGFTWSIRSVYTCRQPTPGPSQTFLLDDFRLVRFDNPDLSWPVRDYTMGCEGVPEQGPPFADDEPPAFSVLRSWTFEDGDIGPFSTYGGVSLAVSDAFPLEGTQGLVASWDGVHNGDLYVEVPGDDLVIGRYYEVVASARLAPGTPPRHWSYSTRESAWRQDFSGVIPPSWITFAFQYRGENRAVIHLAQFQKNVSWCGTVENAPDTVYLDQVELRVSAVQEPIVYPAVSCPVQTTSTTTTTTRTTTTRTTMTTRTTTTTRMVDPTVTTTWRPPTGTTGTTTVTAGGTTTSSRPTTTSSRPTTTTRTTTPRVTRTTRPTPPRTTTTRPTTRPTSATGTTSARTCRASWSVTSTWPGYVQAVVTVTAGSAIDGWATTFGVPAGAAVEQAWSTQVAQTGTTVTAQNLSWNGKLAAGASTTYGLIIKGGGTAIPAVTCSAR